MKIGIIGINRYAKFLNFACDLHVYAFQRFLAENGHESTILDYKPAYFGKFDMRNPAPDAEAKYLNAVRKGEGDAELKKLADLAIGYRSVEVERARRFDKFEAFVADRLIFTEEKYDSDLLEVLDPGFDCYVCVTDVIWQSIPRHVFDRGFLLGSKAFEGKSTISYAASRGAAKNFEPDAEAMFFRYLDDIDSVSVRERDFSEYIEQRSEITAPTVLDPVLLHGRDFWDEVTTSPKEERFLLLYYVMEGAADTIAKAVEYAKLHDLTIVELSDRPLKFGRITDPDVKHIAKYDVGMEEWLGYIRDADAVFTNSFHGCCFAILFEKAFFVGARNGQKVPNLLASFMLDGQRFGADTDVRSLPHDIDYAKVREVLDARRKSSSSFILNALNEAEERLSQIDPARTVDYYDARRRSLTFPVHFHSGQAQVDPKLLPSSAPTKVRRHSGGALEYNNPGARFQNDGQSRIPASLFRADARQFLGWTARFRIDNRWFWVLQDGSLAPSDTRGVELEERKALLQVGDSFPHLPVNHVSVVVMVAMWSAPDTEADPVRATPTLARRIYRRIRRALRSS